MKLTLIGILSLALVATCPSSLFAAKPKQDPRHFVIFCSPGLSSPDKEKVLIELQRFLAGGGGQQADATRGMVPGDTIRIYDAQSLDSIGTELTIPFTARNAALQLNSARELTGAFRSFLKTKDTPDAIVNLPRLVESFREKVPGTNASILLIGTPIYHDDVPAHDMRTGWLSDGYFAQDHFATIFSTKGCDGLLSGGKFYFCTIPDDSWGTDNKAAHQERTRRFWALYLQQCGGSLLSFQHDPSTAFHAMVTTTLQDIANINGYKVDPEDVNMVVWKSITEMKSGTKTNSASTGTMVTGANTNSMVDLSGLDWLTKEPAEYQRIHPGPHPLPPSGKCLIGLSWPTTDKSDSTDLDLHVRAKGNQEDLFWKNPHTALGTHYKDFSNPDASHGYEIVDLTNPVSLNNLEIWVNAYNGHSPNGFRGEARVLYAGKLLCFPFLIPGKKGDNGEEFQSRDLNPSWVRIPIETAH